MFSLCLKLLTIVTFAGHVMLGCCAHHVHATEAATGDQNITVVVEHKHAHSNCSHRHTPTESTDGEPAEHPEHPGDCDDVECSYLESNEIVSPVDLSSWTLFDADVTLAEHSVLTDSATSLTTNREDGCRQNSAVATCADLHRWQL